jgi:prepilin peptidase CpaA
MCLATIPQGLEPAVIILCLVLLVEAYIDLLYLKVPNKITFPMILLGWLLAMIAGWAHGARLSESAVPFEFLWYFHFELYSPLAFALDYLWSSVCLTFFGFLLLWPLYAIGGMGAGDVKMQMGFGAWVAWIYGYHAGWWIVLCAFCFAAVVGGVISALMIWWRGEFRQNIQNTKEILGDLVGSKGNVPEIAQKAAERKPRLHLLPYGVPLCIGYIAWVVIDHWNLVDFTQWKPW